MAQTGMLAQRYGEGFFRVVRESGRYREAAVELASFLALIEENPQVRDLMVNPVYGVEERLALLEGIQEKAKYSDPTHGLLHVLIQRNRIGELRSILEAYESFYRAELGVVSAEVTTAVEADGALKARVQEALRRLTGKDPEVSFQTDPAIIGGLKVKLGNSILDASVKSKLERMHQALLEPEQASS